MGILQIAPVTRRGMRLMVNLYGMSETGKTLSGLYLAAGFEPDPAKRGLLDTEGGQRGRAYVDLIPGGYLYAHLEPPYSPERYREAVKEFEAAGCNILVVDSISHAWFAEGGILDMVEDSQLKNEKAKWKDPKRRLSKMTQKIFHSDMHMILCSRAKRPLVDGPLGSNGKPTQIEGPVVPIQEKGLWFDFMLIAHMTGDGRYSVTRPEGKCPGLLRDTFAAYPLMSIELGRKLAEWVDADGGKTPEQRLLEDEADEEARKGVISFRDYWKTLKPEQRALLKPKLGDFESRATAAVNEKKRIADELEKERLQEEADRIARGGPGQAAATASSEPPAETGKDAGPEVKEQLQQQTSDWLPVLPPKPADASKWGEWLMALKVKILAAKEEVDVDELAQAIKTIKTTIPPAFDGEIQRALKERLAQLS